MQNIYIVILTLILTIYLKSVFGNIFLNDQSENRYRSNYRNDLLKMKELLQSLKIENAENVDYSKNSNVHSNDNEVTENLESRVPHDGTYNDDAVRLLWNIYTDLLEKKEKLHDENRENGVSRKHDKRALTMLSRWKPFRLNTLNGGNGRHVIRSPFTSRSDPNSFNRIQIMGRPFRWG